VVVTYGISRDRISVKVDFSLLLKRNLQRIAILNEQSSRFFRRYSDSKGTKLIDEKIGSWETVEAEWASITDL
ncbi:hypothetical protein GTO27_00495, partial [Candidatus Bathyarchaeota archaeon]|nr:hypothetical protein [Candidatus Bathyarchaeota archaeon]